MIMENRKASDSDNLESFVDVENLIKSGNISLAQEKLDSKNFYAINPEFDKGCGR